MCDVLRMRRERPSVRLTGVRFHATLGQWVETEPSRRKLLGDQTHAGLRRNSAAGMAGADRPLGEFRTVMSMWEPFTERARRSIVLAQEEAQRLGNNYIGTEHILLGIISEGESLAAKVLETLGVNLAKVRQEVE